VNHEPVKKETDACVCGICGGEGKILHPLFDKHPVPCPKCAFNISKPVTSDMILAAAKAAGEKVQVHRIPDHDERYLIKDGWCWLTTFLLPAASLSAQETQCVNTKRGGLMDENPTRWRL
jgi:hypothetical protein